MNTLIQCLPGFVASIIPDPHYQATNYFDSSHPTTFSYSSLSSSSHSPRYRSTHWQHICKHAYVVSNGDSETAQADTSGKCRPTTCALCVAAPRIRINARQTVVKTTEYTIVLRFARVEGVFLAVTCHCCYIVVLFLLPCIVQFFNTLTLHVVTKVKAKRY